MCRTTSDWLYYLCILIFNRRKKMNIRHFIKYRIQALALTVFMLLAMLPTAVAAAEPQVSYIGITSDVHGSATNVANWMNSNGNSLEYMVFGGDTGDSWNSGSNSGEATVTKIKNTLTNNYAGITPIFTMGNHDWMGGTEQTFQTVTGFLRIGVQNASSVSTDGYTIYTLGVSSNASGPYSFPAADITALGQALDTADPAEPFFIVSHYPLHYGDNRTGTNASTLIDLLNKHPNVFFFWGHNHHSDTNMGTIKVAGDMIIPADATTSSKQINFTYCNSGHMGNESGLSTDKYGTGVRIAITNDGGAAAVELSFKKMAGGAPLTSKSVNLGVASGPLSNVSVTGITAPVSSGTPDTDAVVLNGTATVGPITWMPPVNGSFKPDTVYTASMTLTAANSRSFNQSTSVTVNSQPVPGSTFNTDGTITVNYVFPAASDSDQTVIYKKTTTITSGHEYAIVLGSAAMNTTAASSSSSISGSTVDYTGFGYILPTISGDDLTFATEADAEAATWTFTNAGADNQWYISNGVQYANAPAARTMALSTTPMAWTYGDMAGTSKGTQLYAHLGEDDCNLCYGGSLSTTTVNFVYPSVNNNNTLALFEKSTETNGGSDEDSGTAYGLASSIESGSTYIVVAKSGSNAYALTNSVANTNYLACTPVTVSGSSISVDSVTDGMVWKFTTDGNGFDVTNGSNYLNRRNLSDNGGIYTSATEDSAQYSDWICANESNPYFLNTHSGSGSSAKDAYLYLASSGSTYYFSADNITNSSREIYLYKVPDLPINSVAITDITTPVVGETPDTSTATPGGIYFTGSVTWNPQDVTFAGNMVYTASVTLTAASGHEFTDSTTATVNGSTATSVTLNADRTLTVTYAFPKTGAAPITIYEEAPSVENGGTYVIVSQSENSAYALMNESVTSGSTSYLKSMAVSISGILITSGITSANVDKLVWTFSSASSGNYDVKNAGKYLTRPSGSSGLKTDSADGGATTTDWKYLSNSLSVKGNSSTYFLHYNNNGYFDNSTTNNAIHLYKKILKPVATPPVISTTTLQGGTVGAAYSQTLAATGDTPITWTVDSGNLPSGLSLTGDTISGTPTTAGAFSFTVKAENTGGNDSKALSITISEPAPVFVPVTNITDISAAATVGSDLTLTGTVVPANATNKTIVWSVSNAGSTGVTITGSVLSTSGAGIVNLTATIVNGTTATTNYTKNFSITINEPVPVFVPVTNIADVTFAATVGSDLTLTGTVVPANATNKTIVWSVSNAGSTGATITGSVLSTTGVGVVNVIATIVNGATVTTNFTKNFDIVVSSATPVVTPPAITTTSLPDGTEGTPYSQTLAANDDSRITWTIDSGSLPGGLSLTGNTISGTPMTAGVFKFVVKATNSEGNDTQALSISISPVTPPVTPPVIITTSLPGGTVGIPYSQVLAATGDTPITWSIVSGTLPGGLSHTGSTISGTPTVAGAFNYTVRATNRGGSDTQALSIAISPAAPTATPPAITTTTLPGGTVGTPYSQALMATGDTPIMWSIVSGTLPGGLSLAGNTISGTPTTAVSLSFIVKAVNSAGNDTQALSIAISAATPPATSSDDTTSTPPSSAVGTGSSIVLPKEDIPASGLLNVNQGNTGYSDVPVDAWYYGAVKFSTLKGLFKGISENTFAPELTVSRAMFVTVISRIEFGSDGKVSKGTSPFTDLTQNWYKNDVAWGARNNIATGVSATKFAPDNNVTREQMAVFMYRYAKYKGYDTTYHAEDMKAWKAFTDAADVNVYARDAMMWAVSKGFIKGLTATTLGPRSSTTRAQVATIAMRFCELFN
jgi:hypothetical protein